MANHQKKYREFDASWDLGGIPAAGDPSAKRPRPVEGYYLGRCVDMYGMDDSKAHFEIVWDQYKVWAKMRWPNKTPEGALDRSDGVLSFWVAAFAGIVTPVESRPANWDKMSVGDQQAWDASNEALFTYEGVQYKRVYSASDISSARVRMHRSTFMGGGDDPRPRFLCLFYKEKGWKSTKGERAGQWNPDVKLQVAGPWAKNKEIFDAAKARAAEAARVSAVDRGTPNPAGPSAQPPGPESLGRDTPAWGHNTTTTVGAVSSALGLPTPRG